MTSAQQELPCADVGRACLTSPLPVLRDAVIDHFRPLPRWPERRRHSLRIAPCMLTASLAFGCAVLFLLVTNHDSRTCNEAVVFEYWSEERRLSGCKMYDSLQADWLARLQAQDFPNISITYARGQQLLPQDRTDRGAAFYQPTSLPPAYSNYTRPIAIPQLELRFQPVNGALLVNVDAVLHFAEFDFQQDIVGFILQPGTLASLDGIVTVSTDRVNWADPLDNLTVTVNPEGDLKLQAAALRLLYWPLMVQQEQFMDLAYDAFLDSRHIMHCDVCLPESAVSIAWIVLLGTLQAASTIGALTGYCIRRCNPEDEEADRPLLLDDGLSERWPVQILPDAASVRAAV